MTAAIRLVAAGVSVDIVSPRPLARVPAMAEGGINTGSDPDALYRDTISCGDYLAPRGPVRAMVDGAAEIIDWLSSLATPFARDDDGNLALRRLEGAREPYAAHVHSSTTAQIAWALDTELMRLEADGSGTVRRLELHSPTSIVVRDGQARAVAVRHLVSGDHSVLTADAILLAGPRSHAPFGDRSLALALRAGAELAGCGAFRLHPAMMVRRGRSVLLSSALRAEGARFWVPQVEQEARMPSRIPSSERTFFLETAHPEYGSLVADDLAARALWRLFDDNRGIYDRKRRKHNRACYLDITHYPEQHLRSRVGRELDACVPLIAGDPYVVPLEVTATVAGSLLGLAVSADHASNIVGLYAAGAAACLYHGRCPLGGNVLLADVFGARKAAETIASFVERAGDAPEIQPPTFEAPGATPTLVGIAETLALDGDIDKAREAANVLEGVDDADALLIEVALRGAAIAQPDAQRQQAYARLEDELLVEPRTIDPGDVAIGERPLRGTSDTTSECAGDDDG